MHKRYARKMIVNAISNCSWSETKLKLINVIKRLDMRFSKEVKEVEDYEGGFSYWPIIVLDGEVTYFKEQGNIVFYDNKEDAEEYIKD